MAVVTLFMSDRDPQKTFTNKKEADLYDKKLELAENLQCWLEQHVQGLSEEHSETISLLIADNKDMIAQAFKGKSDVLLDNQSDGDSDDQSGSVTPIAANS